MEYKRTIPEILNLKSGDFINSDEFFKKPIDEIFKFRYSLDKEIQSNEKLHVCFLCKQSIKIRGQINAKNILHFAHLRESDLCPLKDIANLSRSDILRLKFNGAKESTLHIFLKEEIAKYLELNKTENKGITEVNIEKVIKDKMVSKTWKKPDISTVYKKHGLVFELQLSTTFLSVIVEREEFYYQNRTFIIWIFHKFQTEFEKRRFTQSDVFYSNNNNAFEFNNSMRNLSTKDKDLILNCIYEEPIIEQNKIINIIKEKQVRLGELTFNFNNYKVYYFDYENTKIKLLETLKIQNSSFLQIDIYLNTDIFIRRLNLIKLEQFEKVEIRKLYKIYVESETQIAKENYLANNIIWTLIAMKFERNNEMLQIISTNYYYQRIIIDIVILKSKIIIGYGFKTIKQVIHASLMRQPEYYPYILHIMEKFGYSDYLNDPKIIAKIGNAKKHNGELKEMKNMILNVMIKE